MEEDFFDIAIEGTTINDIYGMMKEENTRKIVFDKGCNYGSTYTSLNKLSKSQYINNLQIIKSENERVTVEALPFLLRPMHPAVKAYTKKPFGGHIEYIDINNVIFMDKTGCVIKLPMCKSDIVNMEGLNNSARYYMHEGIKKKNINTFKKYLTENCDKGNIYYKAFVKYELFSAGYFQSFGESPFIYPVYGSSEISENISLHNSLKGTSYLLSRDVNISEYNMNGYKYRLVCEHGVLYFNQLITQILKKKTCNVRMIQVNSPLYDGNFTGHFESSEVLQVIGLDSRTRTCPKGMQTLYFIKMGGEVTQNEIFQFIGVETAIQVDLSFQTTYDPSQFENYQVDSWISNGSK